MLINFFNHRLIDKMGSLASQFFSPDTKSVKIIDERPSTDMNSVHHNAAKEDETVKKDATSVKGEAHAPHILVSIMRNKTIIISEAKTVATQTDDADNTEKMRVVSRLNSLEEEVEDAINNPPISTRFEEHEGGSKEDVTNNAHASTRFEEHEGGSKEDVTNNAHASTRFEEHEDGTKEDVTNNAHASTRFEENVGGTKENGELEENEEIVDDKNVKKIAWKDELTEKNEGTNEKVKLKHEDENIERNVNDKAETEYVANSVEVTEKSKEDTGIIFNNVDENKSPEWYENIPPVSPFEQVSLERYGKYKVRLESDKEKCTVSASAFLDTGDMVVIDRSNQKIKLVDSKFQFISSENLSAKPWAVCTRGFDVYVTMGNTHIQKFFVKDMTIEPERVFEIKGRCLGICLFGEHLAIGLQVGEICIIDAAGETHGKIQLPALDNGKPCNPWHLCETTEHNLLVTDSDAHTIFCINKDAAIVFTFKGLSSPRGTAVDYEGNILVVGRDIETGVVIAMLPRDLELQNMLHIEDKPEARSRALMTWDQLEFVPYCVTYRRDHTVVLGGIQETLKIMKLV